jgi:hypothetical protein
VNESNFIAFPDGEPVSTSETRQNKRYRSAVAGLDPAIHPFAKMMDARVEPAYEVVERT